MNIAREMDQLGQIVPGSVAELLGSTNQCAAIHPYPARRADPLQPGNERAARESARSMKLARDVADGFLNVTSNHHLLMTGVFDQLCYVLQKPLAPDA